MSATIVTLREWARDHETQPHAARYLAASSTLEQAQSFITLATLQRARAEMIRNGYAMGPAAFMGAYTGRLGKGEDQ